MIVGILKEIKIDENRVAITPAGVEVMTNGGHTVLVEKDAGTVSGFEDSQYAEAGAEVSPDTPQDNPAALALARRFNLQPAFETARMYRGTAPTLPLARTFGITTFELG